MENPKFIFSSEPIELKEEGNDFYVEGYISTSDLDLVNDIVTKGCIMDMAEQMKKRTIKLDVEHESFRGKSETELEINKTIIPAAKVDDFLVDKKGLKVRAMLNRHTQRFDEVKGSIKDGFLDAFSIAYVPVKSMIENRNGKEIRLLDKINLLNVAFTGNPVNTEARMINVFAKSLDFLKNKEEEEKARSIEARRTAARNESLRESEAEEDDEEEKKKKKEEKDHIHESDNKLNLKEVKKMSEEETKEAIKSEDSSEKAKEKPKPEEDDEEKKKKMQKKDEELLEAKSEIETLKKEMMEVKAALKKPVLKSTVEQQDKSQNFVEKKSFSPLDMIA